MRARPEGERGGPGPALDPHLGRGRLHLLVQRPALALRRHHALAALARPRRTAWGTRSSRRGTGRCRCSSGSACTPAPRSRFAVYKGRGPRRLGRAGPGGAREPLRRGGRQLPLPGHRSRATRPSRTWTRGLAWVLLGFAEELEFLETVPDAELEPLGGRDEVEGYMMEAARATAAHYVADDAHRRHPLLGHRRPRPRAPARPPRAAGRPRERPRAGGRLGGADRGPGPAAAGAPPRAAGRDGGRAAALPGGPDDHAARSSGRRT